MYLLQYKLPIGGPEKYLYKTKDISPLKNWKCTLYLPCTSFLFLLANLECSNDDFHHFPPLPPVEISSLELPPKKHTDTHQANNTELRPGVIDLQQQLSSSEEKSNGIHPLHGVNGVINSKPNGDKSIPPPAVLLSPTKEPPPVLAKPKLWVFWLGFFVSYELDICWQQIFAWSDLALNKWTVTVPVFLLLWFMCQWAEYRRHLFPLRRATSKGSTFYIPMLLERFKIKSRTEIL